MGIEPTNVFVERKLSTIDSALIFAVTNLKLGASWQIQTVFSSVKSRDFIVKVYNAYIGGDRGNRILLDTLLARESRSPLLPPIILWSGKGESNSHLEYPRLVDYHYPIPWKTSLLRTLGSNQSNHWLTVKSLHLAWILRSKEVSFFALVLISPI